MLIAERIISIDSTQRECIRRLAAAEEPFAIWTTAQTQGVASHGRRWQDSPEGLAISVAWPAYADGPIDHACWPSRIGLLVHSVLTGHFPEHANHFGLKWPNDLMGSGRKLGGVLVSRHRAGSTDWWVAGVGLNLGWPEGAPAVDRPVIDLASMGCKTQAFDLAQAILVAFNQAVILRQNHLIHTSSWVEHFHKHDVLANQPVRILHPQSGSVLQQGIHRGMNSAGELLLETALGVTSVRIGEASLRPGL